MLVIGRRIGEVVYVEHAGERLAISLQRGNGKGERFRLGFEGPETFRITRAELVDQQRKDRNGN